MKLRITTGQPKEKPKKLRTLPKRPNEAVRELKSKKELWDKTSQDRIHAVPTGPKGQTWKQEKVRRAEVNYLFTDPNGNTWLAKRGIRHFIDWYNEANGTKLSANAFELRLTKMMRGQRAGKNKTNVGWSIQPLPAIRPGNYITLKGLDLKLHMNFDAIGGIRHRLDKLGQKAYNGRRDRLWRYSKQPYNAPPGLLRNKRERKRDEIFYAKHPELQKPPKYMKKEKNPLVKVIYTNKEGIHVNALRDHHNPPVLTPGPNLHPASNLEIPVNEKVLDPVLLDSTSSGGCDVPNV